MSINKTHQFKPFIRFLECRAASKQEPGLEIHQGWKNLELHDDTFLFRNHHAEIGCGFTGTFSKQQL